MYVYGSISVLKLNVSGSVGVQHHRMLMIIGVVCEAGLLLAPSWECGYQYSN